MQHTHITVLLEEAVDGLRVRKSGVYVDATLGAGGHARKIASLLGSGGMLIGIDADARAVDAAEAGEWEHVPTHFAVGNFKNIGSVLSKYETTEVDGVLADLGWRMEQFAGSGKGFSFQVDEPLQMTLGDPEEYAFLAEDIVNEWKEEDIRNVIKAYGEDRFASRIARAIVVAREEERVVRSVQLADIVKRAIPARFASPRIHPATKTFQALRIAVNDELDVLKEFITEAIALLAPEGRLAIITFHSLEDRIVKHTFKDFAHDGVGSVITKKPIVPSADEITENPRARSAKLRIFEKHAEI